MCGAKIRENTHACVRMYHNSGEQGSLVQKCCPGESLTPPFTLKCYRLDQKPHGHAVPTKRVLIFVVAFCTLAAKTTANKDLEKRLKMAAAHPSKLALWGGIHRRDPGSGCSSPGHLLKQVSCGPRWGDDGVSEAPAAPQGWASQEVSLPGARELPLSPRTGL